MKATYIQLAGALTLTFAIAACVPRTAAPVPAPAPRPAAPAPAPAAPPVAQAPVYDSWMDAPATPGSWRYGGQAGRSEASFLNPSGAAMMWLRCQADSRSVVLSLPASGAANPVVTIRSETATRTLPASTADRELSAAIAAGDPLLDAMALSKGKFAVETTGLPPLYLPSWAEVSRVIEDCR